MIYPHGGMVLVERDEVDEIRASGLIVIRQTEDQTYRATVIASGQGERDKVTKRVVPNELKMGDTVVVPSWVGHDVKYEDREYVLVNEHEVLAKETR